MKCRLVVTFLWAALTGFLPGQDLVFIGDSLDAWWTSGAGRLIVQDGTRLLPFRIGDDGLPVFDGPATAGTLPSSSDLEDATFFDVKKGRALVVGRRSFKVLGGSPTEGAVPAPFFRVPYGGAAIRLPLLQSSGAGVVPARPGFLMLSREGRLLATRLPLMAEGEANLGWGLGDDMVVTTVMPNMLFRPRTARCGEAIVSGRDGRYELHPLDGSASRLLEEAPVDSKEGILDIPYAVPPLMANLDGKGGEDLLLTDPSSGTLVLYRDLDAKGPVISRVIKPGGLILYTWARDLDGDSIPDVTILRLPPMNPLLQLRVIRQGAARGELMVYRGRSTGPAASPDHRRDVEVPLRVGIRNGVREARLPMVLVPLRGPAALMVDSSGSLYHLDIAGEGDPTRVGTVPPGRSAAPFRGVDLPGGRVLFSWRTESDVRLYSAGPF
jgi:hypothetical protein